MSKRKIQLEMVTEFSGRCELRIMDVTESPNRKRGTITVDYAPADLQRLLDEGMDTAKALEYYEQRIYDLVKYYISGDWEWISGRDEIMEMIKRHIEPRMEKK